MHPTFIPQSNLLASVNGVFNAVETYAEGMGSTVLYGRGAGDMPTGHAVISDVIQCAQDSIARRPVDYSNFFTPNKKVRAVSEIMGEYYMEINVIDKPGVLATIAGILGEQNISILSMLQTEAGREVPLAIMTHEAREADVVIALDRIEALDFVLQRPKLIRIEKSEGSN